MAKVIINIIIIASPTKRAALEKVGITTPNKRNVESYCSNNIKRKIFRLKKAVIRNLRKLYVEH